nr:hypothetical protein [Tanacetum cinerariifolium]
MCTRFSSNLPGESSPNPTSSNPKHRNHTMADQRTMAELLRAPTEGYAEAIVVPPILDEHFDVKHSLINIMTSDQFFGLKKDNPHDHIRWGARRWLEKEPPHSILTWEDLVSKFINEFFPPSRTTNLRNEISNFQQRFDESFHEACDRYKDLLRACPHHGFTEFHQLDTFYNALNPVDQDSLNSAAGVNLLERLKSSDANSSSSSEIAKLTHAVNQQTSVVTTAMTTILKQFQATPPPTFVKFVEEICVTCGGAHPYYQCLAADGNTFLEFQDNIQGYVSVAAINYNQAMQSQISNVKNKLRNEMKTSIQASMSNQTNELKNMMASFFQINIASTSGSGPLPSNTIANPKGELKAITTRSGLVLDGPSVPMPSLFINLKDDERVEETLMNLKLDEFTIKVPPPFVQKAKAPSQRNYAVHQRDPLHPNILYPLRMHKQKQQDKDEIQIHKFWQMFKQLHINITLADVMILILNELKCKALANLGASINLVPLSVWKKLDLPELISTRMTLELANRAICTPAGIARDVFVPVGKFTFLADFFIVDYESNPRVPLVLGRPFLRTARALIDVHGEDMILCDGYERLTLNMRHDTSSYSNQPQKESINMINIFNDSCEDYLEDLFATNHLNLPPPYNINPLSGSITSSSPDHLLEEFVDELALIIFPPRNDDLLVDMCNLENPKVNLFYTISEMFTDEHTLDYLSPPLYDEYDDDLFELGSDNDDAYNDPFDSKEEKINESKLLIIEFDPLRSITFQVTPDKNVKKISISNASLILEDFDPSLYELPFHKEVPWPETLFSFSFENEEKVFKPWILTSK